MFFYTGIAITNVSDVLVDCQHNDWDWLTLVRLQHERGEQLRRGYHATPAPERAFPPNLSTPWRQRLCCNLDRQDGPKMALRRKWISVSEPVRETTSGLLNDLWVHDHFCWRLGPRQSPHFFERPEHSRRLSGTRRPAGRGGCSSRHGAPRFAMGQLQLDRPSNWGPLLVWRPGNRHHTGTRCSMTYGSALLALRLMPRAQAPAPAHGPSLEAQRLATRAAPMALKESREAFREADGLPRRPRMHPGISGFSAAKAWTPQARSVC